MRWMKVSKIKPSRAIELIAREREEDLAKIIVDAFLAGGLTASYIGMEDQ